MNKGFGLALLAVGLILIVFGVNASDSFSSDISRLFTGNPTDRSIWLLLGGIAASCIGALTALSGSGRG